MKTSATLKLNSYVLVISAATRPALLTAASVPTATITHC